MEHPFVGTHIITDIWLKKGKKLNDIAFLEEIIRKAALASKATLLKIFSYQFSSGGISIIGIIAESHISIHTYPENNSLFVDIFTCGNKANPEAGLKYIVDALGEGVVITREIMRGEFNNAREDNL